MDWLGPLERRFGKFGIPDLILYVVVGRALAYVLALSYPEYIYYLILDPVKVKHGEVWRLVTYVFTPSGSPVFWAFLELYMTYLVGRALEAVWGPFRFTLYYLIGTLATAGTAFFVLGTPVTPTFLNLSLFFAFSTLFPDFTLMLFAILPIKARYLGWLMGGYLTVQFWIAPLAAKVAILVAFANYLLFFWPRIREWMAQKTRLSRPEPGRPASPVHRCTVCRRTERDDPDLEFRICACPKCGEGKEFCMEHLKEHLSEAGKG